jgi:hypothetical protein
LGKGAKREADGYFEAWRRWQEGEIVSKEIEFEW